MSKLDVAYVPVPAAFGPHVLVWRDAPDAPRIVRVILPGEGAGAEQILHQEFPEAVRKSHRDLEPVCAQIRSFLQGNPVAFSLDLLDFGVCNDFQRLVLLAEAQIPRGQVSTYGRLAIKIGNPRAARAVGGALARNPFPLIIPCHRTIRVDGHLGGFGGGLRLKRALLEMEGIVFDEKGRVPGRFFW